MRDKLYGTDLLSLILDVNDKILPVAEMGSHELINFGKNMVSNHGGADKRKKGTPHVLVSGAMNSSNVAFPKDV